MQDWEVLGKNFDDISDNHIDNKELARLEFHILGVGYLEKGLSRFTKISIKDNNVFGADAKELEPISNFEKEKKNKKNLRKEQKDPPSQACYHRLSVCWWFPLVFFCICSYYAYI